MKFRLSDGFSRSTDAFSASDKQAFPAAIAAAWRQFGGDRAEIHVGLDCGDWIAPSYRIAKSARTYSGRPVLPNMPVHVERGALDVHLWDWCVQAEQAGNALNRSLGGLTDWASQ